MAWDDVDDIDDGDVDDVDGVDVDDDGDEDNAADIWKQWYRDSILWFEVLKERYNKVMSLAQLK